MKKLAIRLSACVLGGAIALGALPFVKAQLWATAVCDRNLDGIYAQMRDLGWSVEDVQRVVDVEEYMGTTCDSATLRGFYFDNDGSLQVIVRVGTEYYFLQYDTDGTLLSVN